MLNVNFFIYLHSDNKSQEDFEYLASDSVEGLVDFGFFLTAEKAH